MKILQLHHGKHILFQGFFNPDSKSGSLECIIEFFFGKLIVHDAPFCFRVQLGFGCFRLLHNRRYFAVQLWEFIEQTLLAKSGDSAGFCFSRCCIDDLQRWGHDTPVNSKTRCFPRISTFWIPNSTQKWCIEFIWFWNIFDCCKSTKHCTQQMLCMI